MGLSPVSVGVVGLAMALFANGMQLLGAHNQTPEDEQTTGQSVAVVGSVAGAITLGFLALWLVIGAPFGKEGTDVVKTQLLYASLSTKFALLWIGVTVAQIRGWSLKPIGTMCAFLAVLQVAEMIMLATLEPGLTTHVWLVEIVFGIYVLVLLGFWALPYGRASARTVGLISLIASFATLYLEYVSGGIIDPPQ